MLHAPQNSVPWIRSPSHTLWRVQILQLLYMQFLPPLVFCSLLSPNDCSILFKQCQCKNMTTTLNTVHHYYFFPSSQTQCFRNNQLFIFRCFWNVVHGRIQNMDDVQENSKVDCTTPSSECTLFFSVCFFSLNVKDSFTYIQSRQHSLKKKHCKILCRLSVNWDFIPKRSRNFSLPCQDHQAHPSCTRHSFSEDKIARVKRCSLTH